MIDNLTFDEFLGRLYADFPFFVRAVFRDRELDIPGKAPLGRVELDICDYMANGPVLRGVLGPRGLGKTHLAAALCCWCWLRDPDFKILVISKSEGTARDTRLLIRQWIQEIPFLRHLLPGREPWQRDSANKFDVGPSKADRTASLRASGIDGQIEGGRAHLVIADDVETGDNVQTMDARINLDERVKQFNDMLYPGGQILYIGTYHHEESLYLKLAQRGYVFRTWTLQYPYDQRHTFLNLAPILQDDLDRGRARPGDPTMPHRFGDDHVAMKKAEGEHHYLMQYMLVSNLAGSAFQRPLKLRDLIVFSVDRDKAPVSITWGTQNHLGPTTCQIPSCGLGDDRLYRPVFVDGNFENYTGTRMRIDPAGAGSDRVGYAIVSHLNGILFTKAVGALTGGPTDENMAMLASLARDHLATEITVEANFGGDAFANLLQVFVNRVAVKPGESEKLPQGWGATVTAVPSKGQKEARIINALRGVMGSHRLVVSEQVAANHALQYQLTRITHERGCLAHEDELECLALCVQDWEEVLAIDPDRASLNSYADKLRAQHDRLQNLIGPVPRKAPNWIDN